MNRIAPATVFLPAGDRDVESLLVLSTSFEHRCLGFPRHLRHAAPEYRAECVVVLRYDDRGDAAVRSRAERLAPEVLDIARKVAVGRRAEEEHLDPFSLMDGAEFFSSLFGRLPRGASVVVDISTISKLHLLFLLSAAKDSGRVATLRLAYTRARYGRYDTLSWGAEEPVIVPGLGMPPETLRFREHLVLFCGLEPDRCYSIWRRFGHDQCLRVLIDGGDEDLDRCAERAARLNPYDPSGRTEVLPAFDPERVCSLLRREYERSRAAGEYLYVAPMTTKWEVLAAWEFFEEVGRDCSAALVYSAPGRLNATGHTREDLGECLAMTVW